MALMFALLALLPTVNAQTVSGQISGVVTDQSGAVIAGVPVQVTNDLTQQPRDFKTDQSGVFLFPGLPPGNYSVHVVQPGFKSFVQHGIHVSAQEDVDLGKLKLEVGEVSTSIEVTAAASPVAADSSDRTITVPQMQIEDTPTAGRNYVDILRSLPGTTQTTTNATRGWGTSSTGINGDMGQFLMTLDGAASQDSGCTGPNGSTTTNCNFGGYLAPSVDSISEVKVLVGNYTAEYGAAAGGQMNVSIKNGTQQFHGTGYWFWRHEELNANSFFDNKNTITVNGIPGIANNPHNGKYRYQNPGFTVGGPVLLPFWKFNRQRNKLFFFFSEDYLHHAGTNGPNYYWMPTALQKKGDFSQTYTNATTPALVVIKDPTTGNPFPSNMIPSGRFNATSAALMNVFPTGGNPTDPNYYNNLTAPYASNMEYVWTNQNPRDDTILRVDYNIDSKTTMYVRLIKDLYAAQGPGSPLGPAGAGWGQGTGFQFNIPADGAAASVVHTFRPNLIEEFTYGVSRGHQMIQVDNAQQFQQQDSLSALVGANGQPVTLPSFFNANSLGIAPNISFGTSGAQNAGITVPSAPSFGWDSRWPFNGTDTLTTITNNVTWVKGKHSAKFGFYFEHDSRNVSVYAVYGTEGSYYFGTDNSNPFDTGYPMSNMLLGSIQAYGEDNQRMVNHNRYKEPQFFAQDTWRITRRLTLDYGLRMAIVGPIYSEGAKLGLFTANTFSTSQAGQLLYPACTVSIASTAACPTADREALNPLTNATYAYPRQAAFDPASYPATGTPYSGMTTYTTNAWKSPPPSWEPRLGFAWDIFGNGKTALRGGFGMFHDRSVTTDRDGDLMQAPPAFRTPIFYNTSFPDLLSSTGFLGTQNVYTSPQTLKVLGTYDWSFGIQRDLTHGTILDVAYVGNIEHHGWSNSSYDLNAIPPYTDWLPTPSAATTPSGEVKRFLDPTAAQYVAPTSGATSFTSGTFYNADLIRSMIGGYTGYGSINAYTFMGEEYYDALQVQVNKRFGRRLQFSTNYTWQKTMNYGFSEWISQKLLKNAQGIPHALNLNFGTGFRTEPI